MKEYLLDFKIADRTVLPGGCAMIEFERADGEKLPPFRPGQFVEIKIPGIPAAMLRRPISICDVTDSGRLLLMVKPAGEATRHLTLMPAGSVVSMIIPLGNGFDTAGAAGKRVLLAGGGVGAAPLINLCRVLADAGAQVEILLGGRSARDVQGLPEYYRGSAQVHVATDDGTVGHHGLVTGHPVLNERFDTIYVCGPTPMMKGMAAIARNRGTECFVSLENMMACGLGACLCCVEKTVKGNVCVCKHGPVFNINELTWQ